MKNLVCLFGVLALLLAACSKDDAQQPVDPPAPSYRFISIEYGPAEIVSDFKSDQTVYRNDGETILEVRHSHESETGISSRFVFETPLDGPLNAPEVSVPEVDSDGNLTSGSFCMVPFVPDEVYTDNWIRMTVTAGPDLPSGTQYRVVVTHITYDVTAPFVCSLRNNSSGEIEQVHGCWYGTRRHGTKTEGSFLAIE